MTRKTGDELRVVELYTKGEINERWRNRTGNEGYGWLS